MDTIIPMDTLPNAVTPIDTLPNAVAPIDTHPNPVAPMDAQQPRRQIPKFQFRVLIIGRANAGKTSILQRVCDTTNSPIIYRGNQRVRGSTFFYLRV